LLLHGFLKLDRRGKEGACPPFSFLPLEKEKKKKTLVCGLDFEFWDF
jgi:hypothetical protein